MQTIWVDSADIQIVTKSKEFRHKIVLKTIQLIRKNCVELNINYFNPEIIINSLHPSEVLWILIFDFIYYTYYSIIADLKSSINN